MSKKILVLVFSLFVITLMGFSNSANAEGKPSIVITSPNGGEKLEKGKTYTIKWKQANISGVWISFSFSSGWTAVNKFAVDVNATTGSYEWTIPTAAKDFPADDDYKISIYGYSGDGSSVEDSSDASFSVLLPPTSPVRNFSITTLSLFPLYPKVGDEITFTSEIKNIGSNNSGPFTVCDSFDDIKTNCNSGYVLAPGESKIITWTRTPNWPSQFVAGASCWFGIEINGEFIKKLMFIVQDKENTPIVVQRLFSGQYNDTKYKIIAKEHNGIQKIKITKADGGFLTSNFPCSAEIETDVVTLLPTDFPLTVSFNDCKDPLVVYTIQIQMPALFDAPSITALFPLKINQGQTVNMIITGHNLAGAGNYSGCGISPVLDRGFQFVSCQEISDTQINAKFLVATDAVVGSRNIIIQTYKGKSNSVEFFVNSLVAPSISVLSPNGGEKWKVGETHRISWNSTGVGPKVSIFIKHLKIGISDDIVDLLDSNIGYYDWTIPKFFASNEGENNFKIYIDNANAFANNNCINNNNNCNIYDESDVPFSIVAPTSIQPSIIEKPTKPQQIETKKPIDIPYKDGSLLRAKNGKQVYFVEDEKLRSIDSPQIFKNHGFKIKDIINVTPKAMEKYEINDEALLPYPDGALLKSTGKVYFVQDEKIRAVLSPKIFRAYGFKVKNVITIARGIMEEYEMGEPLLPYPNGALLKIAGDNKIYFVQDDSLRYVSSLKAWKANNFKRKNIITVTPEAVEEYEDGEPLK